MTLANNDTITAALLKALKNNAVPTVRDERIAQATFAAISVAAGGGRNPRLLTGQLDVAKLSHNDSGRYWQSIQYLAPARESGIANVCKWSTIGCRAVCLNDSGRLGMAPAQVAQRVRTIFLVTEPAAYLVQLRRETRLQKRRAVKLGVPHVCRLNGTSDITYDRVAGLAAYLPDVDKFQDYTKRPHHMVAPAGPDTAWHLTMSATERTVTADDYVDGMAVVVNVPRGHELPRRWYGRPVIDGDKDTGDIRLDDHKTPRAVVLLRAKGRARRSAAGPANFVKDATDMALDAPHRSHYVPDRPRRRTLESILTDITAGR